MSAPQDLIADRYRLVARVGAGGMGVVWEAWDERLGRPVAVKQLHRQPGLTEAEAELANQRAMREARITARLHHRHAVPVFDVVEHDGQSCLVMQFVPSMTLAAVLREGGPLQPEEAAQVGAQVASALAAAHQLGIVHRDVKPANVLIANDGAALISDFGISRALDDATLTATGTMFGTPAYLAPEVARGGSFSTASDVFSLGGTLYAALEGAPPFGTDQNSIALLYRVASGEFTPPQHTGPLTPVVLQMLAKEPADRPTMKAVATTLAALTSRGAGSPDLPAAATVVLAPAPTEPPLMSPAPASSESEPAPPMPAAPEPAPPMPIPAASSARGASPVSPPPAQEPRRRSGRTAVLVAALLVVGTLIAVLLPRLEGPGSTTTGQIGRTASPVAATASASSRTSASATPSPSPSHRSSAPPSESSPSESSPSGSTPSATTPSESSRSESSRRPSSAPPSTTSVPADDAPSATQLARAITDYYALMPDDTDSAWPRMTASYQANTAGGRRSYERFWDDIRRVSVNDVTGDPPARAQATVTYLYKDGRVVTEPTSYRLVNDGGILKINSSTVLSSSSQ